MSRTLHGSSISAAEQSLTPMETRRTRFRRVGLSQLSASNLTVVDVAAVHRRRARRMAVPLVSARRDMSHSGVTASARRPARCRIPAPHRCGEGEHILGRTPHVVDPNRRDRRAGDVERPGDTDMTEDSDFKNLVRDRMARTGETYTAARAALRPDSAADMTGAEDRDTTTIAQDAIDPGVSDSWDDRSRGESSMAAYLRIDSELGVDDLVMLKSIGITPTAFAGFLAARPGCSLDDVVTLHTTGVTTGVLAAWQKIDPRLELDDILGALAVGLTAETMAGYRVGFGDLTVDQALALHTVGVTP